MKTKAIAVLAVLAMAFAVVAVYDDADATVTANHSKILAEFSTAEGAANTVAIPMTESTEGTTYTSIVWTSTNDNVIADSTGTITTWPATFAVAGVGHTTLAFTVTSADAEPVVSNFTVDVYSYSPYANATETKVIGYAKANTGLQGIVYSDGTALLDFPTSVAVNHVSVAVYNGTSYDAFAGMIGFEQRMNLDFRGVLDVTAITDNDDATLFQIGLTSAFATANNDLGVLNFQPYSVTLDVNTANHGITFENLEETAGTAVTTAVIGTAASTTPAAPAINMIKGATLENIVYREAGATVEELNLFDAITPTGEESVNFIGFASVATATEAELAIAEDTVIEDFIFGLETAVVSDVETAYAIWGQVIYQIYISNGATPAVLDQGSNDVEIDSVTYTVDAPSVALSGDVVLVKIINHDNINVRYTLSFFEYENYATAPVEITDLETRMLTNSIIAVTGIDSDIVIQLEVATTTDAVYGYQFGMQSVSNTTAGVGTAVAQLTLFDYLPANDANLAITMDGTFFRTLGNTHIFGSIANLTAQGNLVYNAVIDGVAQQTTGADPVPIAYGEAGVGVTADHNNYVVSLVNPTGGNVGFYAVKAIFGDGVDDDETNYMLM